MDGRNQENPTELFKKFFDAEQAKKCVEDIQEGEQILREHPAPEPDDMLIANIKAEIAMRLPARRASLFRRVVYRTAAVAAALIIITAISVLFFERSDEPTEFVHASLIPASIWESDDIASDDMDLAGFAVEIEQIESELLALQMGEEGLDSDSAITELELELMEIDSDFWKG